MKWLGIYRHTTDVDDTPGVSIWQQNTRTMVDGELQRRPGFLSSEIAKQAGAIYGIVGAGPANGSFVMLDVGNGATVGGGTVGGDPQPPRPPPPPKKPKWPPPMDPCTPWVTQTDTGTTSDTFTMTLGANRCAGRITMTGTEDAGRTRGTGYGYTFVVDIDGVNAFASGCLQDDSVTFDFPKGTRTIDINITGGCAGGVQPGQWDIDVSQL